MPKKVKGKAETEKPKVKTLSEKQEEPLEDQDEFDFGGFPKDVPFKRNMGCGG